MADTSNLLRSEAELILQQTRATKAEKIKDLGEPITLVGKALDMHIDGQHAWIAENTTVARKIDLETGKTVQLFKGHTAPVTSLVLYESVLITGSWDKTIKVWDLSTKSELSSTEAHEDFVKALFVIPKLKLLVSSGSDKVVRLWDLTDVRSGQALQSVASINAHTRPVESIYGRPTSDTSGLLYTADTMGMIKSWTLKKDESDGKWLATPDKDINIHRTRVNDLKYEEERLWTASADDFVKVSTASENKSVEIPHPTAVRCLLPLHSTGLGEPYLITGAGDIIRAFDVSTVSEPEPLGEIDGHWHDVVKLGLWSRPVTIDDGRKGIEPWLISASLDGTIRKWKLKDLLKPKAKAETASVVPEPTPKPKYEPFEMSEEEERELQELMEDD